MGDPRREAPQICETRRPFRLLREFGHRQEHVFRVVDLFGDKATHDFDHSISPITTLQLELVPLRRAEFHQTVQMCLKNGPGEGFDEHLNRLAKRVLARGPKKIQATLVDVVDLPSGVEHKVSERRRIEQRVVHRALHTYDGVEFGFGHVRILSHPGQKVRVYYRMAFSVLIVDDDRVFCEELSEALDAFRVATAHSGREALDLLEQPNDIDLVLLDVRLPRTRGTDLLRVLKERYPDVSVVMLTAFGSKDVVLSALRNHADDFLEKPVDVERLVGTIHTLLESKHAGGEEGIADRVCDFLTRNIEKKIGIDDVARLIGYSPKHTSALFKRLTGETFTEHRVRQKIEEAKKRLVRSGQPVKQIAHDLAYENPESFVRIFKRRTGLTPTQYRTDFDGGQKTIQWDQ
jgi:two-component system, response regulator YesN